jgi:hypothetical protein
MDCNLEPNKPISDQFQIILGLKCTPTGYLGNLENGRGSFQRDDFYTTHTTVTLDCNNRVVLIRSYPIYEDKEKQKNYFVLIHLSEEGFCVSLGKSEFEDLEIIDLYVPKLPEKNLKDQEGITWHWSELLQSEPKTLIVNHLFVFRWGFKISQFLEELRIKL